MKIGIVAPFETSSLIDIIGDESHLLPLGYPGAPIISTIVRALIQLGHKVTIYTTDTHMIPFHKQPVKFSNNLITIYYCPSRPRSIRSQDGYIGRLLDLFKVERAALHKVINEDNPDVVHAHWAYEFAWAAIDSGIPHVITFHDSPKKVLRHMPNIYRLVRYFMAKKTIKCAKTVSTVSPYMQQEIMRWSKRHVELVPNAIENEWFELAISPENRDLSNPIIGVISNGWSNLKNVKPALKAFALIRKKIPTATLQLFGIDYGENERAYLWCKENNLLKGVTFNGKVTYDSLKNYFKEFTILLHPSLEESFGVTVIEAMALAIPVIGGHKTGAIPWLLENGKVGRLTNVKDEQCIAEALLDILENKENYIKLSTLGQTSARSRFLMQNVARQYQDLYRQVLSQP